MCGGCVASLTALQPSRLWLPTHHLLMWQVEPFDIANYYRLHLHRKADGRLVHYTQKRTGVFWRLDEMCQREARNAASEAGQGFFTYTFSHHWADHLETLGGSVPDELPTDLPPVESLEVPVGLSGPLWEGARASAAKAAARKQRTSQTGVENV